MLVFLLFSFSSSIQFMWKEFIMKISWFHIFMFRCLFDSLFFHASTLWYKFHGNNGNFGFYPSGTEFFRFAVHHFCCAKAIWCANEAREYIRMCWLLSICIKAFWMFKFVYRIAFLTIFHITVTDWDLRMFHYSSMSWVWG